MYPKSNLLAHRIFRCDKSDFYHSEIEVANDTHSDAKLKVIADSGFNGIWLHGSIRELVATSLFRHYSTDVVKARDALNLLCERARRFDLGVWLYLTEPLGLPASHPFWKANQGLAGHETTIPSLMDFIVEEPRLALCSSTPQVKEYLREGFAKLCESAPLEGMFLVTASEHVSNCWAHVLSNPDSYPMSPESFWTAQCQCPRCRELGPAKVIADIINVINGSVMSVRPQVKVVAWDWSWNMHATPPYKQMLDQLSENVILMGDFERGVVEHGGRTGTFEDYSLMYPGPADRFRDEVNLTAGARDMFAVLRINTTFELATVPNLPLMVSLFRKLSYLNSTKVVGAMATWNIGCFTDTLNVFAFDKFCKEPGEYAEEDWLESLARDYFGSGVNPGLVADAWCGFQEAADHYPVNGNRFVYFSPTSYALSYPLRLTFTGKPMGLSAIEQHEYGDRLEDSLEHLELDVVVGMLEKLSSKWLEACVSFEHGLTNAENTQAAENELGVAVVAGCCFRSSYNIYRWYQQRKDHTAKTLTDEERRTVLDEMDNLEKALPFVKSDQRLGFQQEANCYMYSSDKIMNKIDELKRLL